MIKMQRAGVHLDVVDRVAVVTLDAPERRNALDVAMGEQIAATFDEIEGSGTAGAGAGAVVVTGAPPAFCAGADLAQLDALEPEGLRALYTGFLRVGRCPLPTVAAVNGAAVGAGMNLALACDVRLAGRSARFESRFRDLGIHPGGGHTWMLRQVVGLEATFATAVFGEVLTGEEAERRGLVWRCVDDEVLLDEAVDLAARAAATPRDLLARIKATVVDMGAISSWPAAVEREVEPQVWSAHQPEFQARLAKLRARVPRRA
jgi:enoyl-CoA hydratase